MRKCLFLDRDGVINRDIGYAYKPEDIEFMPGIFKLCKHFQQRGYDIIIVTNQSGIARGYYSEEDFQALNDWMINEFKQRLVNIQDIFHCPHHPKITGDCPCRKPKPGMLLKAMKKYRIAPQFSVMIGDKKSDMIAAEKAGIPHRILLQKDGPSLRGRSESQATTLHIKALQDVITKMDIR